MNQAFERVWHSSLQYKLKHLLPHNLYKLVESYMSESFFNVNHNEIIILLYNSTWSLGSVLGPTLYKISTADIPQTESVEIATFADVTAITTVHCEPNRTIKLLQKGLNEIENWKIKIC